MVVISMLYLADPVAPFHWQYYLERHMPRSIALLSTHPKFCGVSVERGLGGGAPGTPATYVAACHYRFETMDDFLAAFTPHAAELQGDIKDYSSREPVIQVSAVELSRETRS